MITKSYCADKKSEQGHTSKKATQFLQALKVSEITV